MNERGAAGLTDTRPAWGQSTRGGGGTDRSKCPRSAYCAGGHRQAGAFPRVSFGPQRLPGSTGAPGRSGAEAFLLCFSLLETDGEADVAFQGTGARPSLRGEGGHGADGESGAAFGRRETTLSAGQLQRVSPGGHRSLGRRGGSDALRVQTELHAQDKNRIPESLGSQ